MDFHSAAELFPLMEGAEFDALKADIQAHGQLEPIRVDTTTKQIIDGRNRYRACRELGIEPRFEWWEGPDPIAYVLSENLHRRHLNESQRDMVGARAADMRQGDNRYTVDTPNGGSTSQADAARMLNTSLRGIQRAAKVLRSGDPELVRAVDAAQVPVSAAAGLVDMPATKRRAILEKINTGAAKNTQDAFRLVKREEVRNAPKLDGKYRVIYADPPWEYQGDYMNRYGHAQSHYPAMSTAELCALPIKELAEENAVLFLWTTSPKLEEAFAVIGAWGFAYKTSFVWDKVKHNFGHYNSVRHEFLLIGGRGSSVPDVDERIDSVQTIERSEIHSDKPEEFRQIIDRLYTHGSRIELFARRAVDGWQRWGNEA